MTEDNAKTGYPFQESVDKLRREFERLLEVAVDQGGRALDQFGLRTTDGPWIPLVDMIETPEEITVFINLPGVDPESVDLHVAGNMLTISGDVPKVEAGEDDTIHLCERGKGSFLRSLPMPVAVNAESVSAECKAGVLTVRLAKTEAAKPRKIPVKVIGSD